MGEEGDEPQRLPHWLRRRWLDPLAQMDSLIQRKREALGRNPLPGGMFDMLVWARKRIERQDIEIKALEAEIAMTRADCQKKLSAMQDLLEKAGP